MEQKQPPKLRDQLFAKCELMGRSPKTAEAYWGWVERFLRWHRAKNGQWIHPATQGVPEVEAFLTDLACEQNVAPSTQNQALAGILFLYKHVIGRELQNVNALRAKRAIYIPTVCSKSEVVAIFRELSGRDKLISFMLYGCGMRIGEVFETRVAAIDYELNRIHIRQAKGRKDRLVQLPAALVPLLRAQIDETKKWHALDVADGCARVPLPDAFERKCPRAAGELGWYWLFCSAKRSRDPKTQRIGRWHIDETTFTKNLADAVRRAGILKRVTSHTLRHSYATHLYNDHVGLLEIKELLGHNSIITTEIYTHIAQDAPASIRSPLDALLRIA